MHPASSGAFDANSGRRGRTFGGGPAFCRNYHQPARVLGMNGTSTTGWREQFRARNWRRIRLAHREAPAVLIPGPDAHENVARWLENPPEPSGSIRMAHAPGRLPRPFSRGYWRRVAGCYATRSGGTISAFCGGMAPMSRTGGSLRKWRGADYWAVAQHRPAASRPPSPSSLVRQRRAARPRPQGTASST